MAITKPLKEFFNSNKKRRDTRASWKECEHAARLVERKRVSMELHDNILSRIYGLRMLMGYIKISEDKVVQEKYLSYLGDLCQIEKEIRELSRGLSSQWFVTDIHFPDDLKKLIVRQSEIGGDSIDITYTDNVDWDGVEEIIKWNIYRILQQVFNNIHRHAQASFVCVKLFTESNQLILSLSEDGIGFDPDKEFETANGLNNIQFRVQSCGGNIDIKSNINSGTEIQISVPKSIKKESYD